MPASPNSRCSHYAHSLLRLCCTLLSSCSWRSETCGSAPTQAAYSTVLIELNARLQNSPSTGSHETLGAALEESKEQHQDSSKAYTALMGSLAAKDAQVQSAENRLALHKKAAAANLVNKEKQWAAGKYEAHEKLETQNKTLSVQLALKATTVERLNKESVRICAANADLTSKNAVLVDTNAELERTNKDVVAANSELTTRVVELLEENGDLRVRIAQLECENACLRKQVDRLEQRVEQLEKEVRALNIRIAELEEIEKELRKEIARLMTQHITDTATIASLSATVAELRERVASLEAMLKVAGDERDKAREAEQGLEGENKSLDEQVEALTKEKNDRDALIKTLTDDVDTLTKTNARLQAQVAAKDEELKKLRAKLVRALGACSHARKNASLLQLTRTFASHVAARPDQSHRADVLLWVQQLLCVASAQQCSLTWRARVCRPKRRGCSRPPKSCIRSTITWQSTSSLA